LAEIKWIKITTDMFEHEKIDFISTLPEADAIIVIWIRILALAGKCNAGGYIFLTEKIPYTEEMLAQKFKKPVNVVKLAFETFHRLDMIDRDDKGYYLPNWEKYQNIDGLERIREQNRIRKQKERDRKKELPESHVTVTNKSLPIHATDIRIKNKEKEIKKDIVPPQFDEFWSLYPRKIEKQKALSAWEGVIKRGSDPSEVLQATNNYIQQIKVNETETKFIKHPSSFLNKDTWKDYLSTSISPSQQNIPNDKEKRLTFNRRMEIERNEWFASGKSETEWETYYREEEQRELGSGANRTRSDPIKA
jgi:predicted phage replisome organizer